MSARVLTITTRKVSDTRSAIQPDSTTGVNGKKREWLSGIVFTPWALVSVYSQGGSNAYSGYTTVIEGREYYGQEKRARTKRGLAKRAAQFARDCYAEAVS